MDKGLKVTVVEFFWEKGEMFLKICSLLSTVVTFEIILTVPLLFGPMFITGGVEPGIQEQLIWILLERR